MQLSADVFFPNRFSKEEIALLRWKPTHF